MKPGRPSVATDAILDALRAAPLHGMSIDDIAGAASKPRASVKALLHRLQVAGRVHKVSGYCGSRPWAQFFQTAEAAEAGESAARALYQQEPAAPKTRNRGARLKHLIAEVVSRAPLAGITPAEVAAAIGRPYEVIRALLAGRMVAAGEVHALRGWLASGRPWVRYFPSAEAAENGRAAAQAVVDAINLAYAASRPAKEPRPKRVRKQREAVSRDREIGDTRHRRAKPDEIVLSWSKRGMGAVPSRTKLEPTKAAEVVWPEHVQVQVCRPCDVERFRVREPINEGFAAEWRRLRGE